MSAAAASQSFANRVQAARSGLIDATKRAGLERDRYADLIAAQETVVGLYPEFLTEMERLRQPVRDRDLQRAVIAGVRECSTDVIRLTTLRTAVIGAAVLIACMVASAAGAWWYCQANLTTDVSGIEHRLTGPEAEQWLVLMQNNDILASNKTCGPEDGRTACSIVLWTDPLPPPSLAPAKR